MTSSVANFTNKPIPEPDFYSKSGSIILQKFGENNVASYQNLIKSGLFSDACHWLAIQFPTRSAVWWAMICVADALASTNHEILSELLMKWVIDPGPEMQTKLLNLTWLDTPETPIEYLAKAVSWTGPSMLPAHLPVSAPKFDQVGKMIAAAVDLAATGHGKLETTMAYQRFLTFAEAVDNGSLHWENQETTNTKANDLTKPQSLFAIE